MKKCAYKKCLLCENYGLLFLKWVVSLSGCYISLIFYLLELA